MNKRIIIIRYGEKIYYVIQQRNFFFKWNYYTSPEYHEAYYVDNEFNCEYNIILFTNRVDAEYVMNWKDIEYFNAIIKISVEKLNYDNVIKYVVFDKHNNSITNKIFNTIADAKEYITSLPRQIGIIDQ